ncbi:hypothetical protein F5H01DRAFT_346458 [Linnemannia elongata]|nr:hypothetical protein F5H01DRAFT_346458 [Linnemannia elongata]
MFLGCLISYAHGKSGSTLLIILYFIFFRTEHHRKWNMTISRPGDKSQSRPRSGFVCWSRRAKDKPSVAIILFACPLALWGTLVVCCSTMSTLLVLS